jgi:hypothetical protein
MIRVFRKGRYVSGNTPFPLSSKNVVAVRLASFVVVEPGPHARMAIVSTPKK